MTQWIASHWWMAWALFALLAIVAYRLRKRGGDEPLLRRIEYALFPHTDPAHARTREVTISGIAMLVLGIFLAIASALFIVLVFGR